MNEVTKKIMEFVKITGGYEEAKKTIEEELSRIEAHASGLKLKKGWKDRVRKILDPKLFLDRMLPVYEEHYSEEELDAFIKFYRSPVGRRIIRTQSQMRAKVGRVFQKWLSEAIMALEKESPREE